MRTRTSILMGAMAALVLASICMSAVSAITPTQVPYSEGKLWAAGRVLNYNLEFFNRIGTDDGAYQSTVTVSATVKYNITAVAGNAINITETISGITINYPFAINNSHQPFIAVYDQTVAKVDFLQDFANEIHGGPNMPNEFLVANHSVQNVSITSTGISTPLPDYINNVVYYKNNNSVVPQVSSPQIINRFIVSSNITGAIVSTTPVVRNAEGNSSTDKTYAHALFYTPMSFAGQYGTFWLNTGLDLASVSGMGLWNVSLPGAIDTTTYTMAFQESDTYTWHEGLGDAAFRWRAKFEVGYPKVGGTEQAKFDTETGILLEYYTEQTRVDAEINGEFRENVHPQALKCALTSVVGITFGANAEPEVPGFPVITLLVAIGIGFALVYRKYRK